MLGHKGVVVQVRVGGIDAVDLIHLPRREIVIGIQAPATGHQALAPQHLVDTGDAAGEAVGRVEKRGVAVGDLGTDGQQIGVKL